MDNPEKMEKLEKSLQEVREMAVLMGASQEEVPIQKVHDDASKRLLYILLAFLVGVGIAGFATYNYFVYAARTEILNKFKKEELPNIKQEIEAAMVKEALGTLPEVQSRLENSLNDRLDKLVRHYDSKINALIEDRGKRAERKFVMPEKESVLEARHTGGRNIQQGWSFYGTLQDSKWTKRFFDPADTQDPNAMPTPEVTVVARGYVNLRKNSPAYASATGWNYTLAPVIGGVRKSEHAIVNQVTSMNTPLGRYVWIKLSPLQP
jgi:hypothetical protein